MILGLLLGLSTVSLEAADKTLSKLKEGEKVIGELPDDLKRLYSLIVQEKAKFAEKEALIDSLEAHSEARPLTAAEEESIRMLEHEANKCQLLSDIFWHEVRSQMSVVSTPSIGIRENWQLVSMPPANPFGGLVSILGAMLGGPTDCGNPNCPVHGRHGVPV
jgi:hypothetical protein